MLEPSGGSSSSGADGGDNNSDNRNSVVANEGGVVKKAAESKIRCYYRALTEGCGDAACDNTNCVSSGKMTALTSNEAAVMALKLFKSHSPMCQSLRPGSASPTIDSAAAAPTSPPASSLTPARLSPATSADSHVQGAVAAKIASSGDISKESSSCEGGLTHELLLYTLGQCRSEQNYAKLRMMLWSVFSNEIALRRSYIPKDNVIVDINPSSNRDVDIVPAIVDINLLSSREILVVGAESVVTDEKMVVDVTMKESSEMSTKEQLRSTESDLDKDIDSVADSSLMSQEETVCKQSELGDIDKNTLIHAEPSLELMQVDDSQDTLLSASAVPLSESSSSFKSDDNITEQEILERTLPGRAENIKVLGLPLMEEGAGRNYTKGYKVLKNSFPDPKVDFVNLHKSYTLLKSLPECEYMNTLLNAQVRLLKDHLAIKFKSSKSEFQKDLKIVDILVILIENPSFISENDYTETLLEPMSEFLTLLGERQKAVLVVYLAKNWTKERLNSFLSAFHHLITIKLITTESGIGAENDSIQYEKSICAATKAMNLVLMASIVAGEVDLPLLRDMPAPTEVYSSLMASTTATKTPFVPKAPEFDPLARELGIHLLDSRKPLIPFSEFYDEFLSEQLEVDKDYAFYKSSAYKFSFLYHPYILTPATKALALYYDNRIRMFSERRMSVFQTISDGLPATPYLRLRVRRDHIINDALVELEVVAMESPGELRKQLVVEFEGEQGIDEGGVSKEFFQLITEQLFCPDFGMFSVQQDTGHVWFNPRSFESDAQFSLVGLVLGLAIYNNVILDLRLPSVLYKKLCGKPGTFQDLQDCNPTVYRSLLSLLQYEGDDMEEVFVLNFRVGGQDVFGGCYWHNLKEGGENIMVGQHNKQEFVSLYSCWLLNSQVEQQFAPFLRGFLMVTEESPLATLFRPDELELLLCGSQHYDFSELEKNTEYDGGYSRETAVIAWFWEIVNSMSDAEQKQLLQFTTGSARAPVGGLGQLKLVIARHGPDTDRLPTAHTCFNVLLLPEYSSKDKLHDRLHKAIHYSHGFGML